MILILASHADAAARTLVQHWSRQDAALLTPDSLCAEGWRQGDLPPEDSRVNVEGTALRGEDVRGVLVRLAGVPEADLWRIRPAERAYVATEMTAFLLAWLSRLPGPVLNRPTPGCLAGPGWRTEQWIHVAAGLGLPVVPLWRGTNCSSASSPAGPSPRAHTHVSVVGEHCLGSTSSAMEESARRLARAAGVEVLVVQYAGSPEHPLVAGASLWPDLQAPHVAELLLRRMLREDGARTQEVRS